MNVTFLIGNGFDLQLGLKTSYPDFLKWYLALPSEDVDIANFKAKLALEKDCGLWWSDAELGMGEMYGEYADQNIQKYYKCIRNFKQQLVVYLRLEQSKCDYSNEEKIAKSFISFLRTYQAEIMLNQGSVYFQRKAENAIYSFVNFNYTDTLSKIIQCCGGNGARIGDYVYNRSSYADNIGAIIPIHGELSTQIIMGLNDERQIRCAGTTLPLKARRTLIKPIINDEFNRSEDRDAENLIATSDAVVLYGLSLGETDQKWWYLLREWMVPSTSRKIVWFRKDDSPEFDPIMPEDSLDYVDEQKELFLSKIGVSVKHKSYDSIKQRIFIVRNTQKLNFTLVEDKQLVEV